MTELAAEVHRQFVRYFEAATKLAVCPACGRQARCAWDGVRWRCATLFVDGDPVYVPDVPCRRARCGVCGAKFTLYPPGIMPHRHYQLCVVASAIPRVLWDGATLAATAVKATCSRWTVARWVRWLGQVAAPADLQARVVEAAGAPIVIPPTPPTAPRADGVVAEVVEACAAVVAGIEVLATAAGLSLPAIRSVLLAVIGGRSGLTTYRRPVIPEFAHIGFGRRLGMLTM